jgi:hypothetical protein
VERARVRVALGPWQEAEADLDAAAKKASGNFSDYGAHASACLLRGFLLERRGDSAGALAAWRRGAYENWRQARLKARPKDDLPPLGRVAQSTWLLQGVMVGSLAGELSEADARDLLARLLEKVGDGSVASVFKKAVLGLPPAVFQEMCRTAKGREAVRHFAYRDRPYAEILATPGLLIVTEVFHQQALPGPLSPEQGEILWDVTGKLHAAYTSDKLSQAQLFQLALAWKGTRNFLGWGGLAPTLTPEVRGPLAYAMGHRYLRLNRPTDAPDFFRTALNDAPPSSPLRRLAQAELDRLKGK